MPKKKETLYKLPEKPKPKKQPPSIEGFARKFAKVNTGKWITFLHPAHGKVPGKCVGIVFNGYSDPGNIPDFKLTIEGRSKTARNTIDVSLVDSRAQFCSSMQQAINNCKHDNS